jgi:HlyD family secretion protein
VEKYLPTIAGLATVLFAACGGATGSAPEGLESVVVERRDLASSVAATGTVEPIRVIDVKSQASGEILEVTVEIGDRVEQGDLLVRIDPRDVQNAFDQAQADLGVARARLQVAESQLERMQYLHESAAAADEELENAVLEHADANAEQVKAKTNLQLATDRLNDVTVLAPIVGTIVEKNVEDGQIVTSTREVTGGTTLVRMADLTDVQVRTLVDETDIGPVRSGLPATIRVEAYPDREFRGDVLKVEPQAVIEQNVTMFAVLIRIGNEEDLLRPGMNSDVEIVTGRRESVLALTSGAVKTPDEARQLAEVLDLEVPEHEPEPGSGGEVAATPEPGPQLQNMSREERRRYFETLSPAERQRLMRQMRAAREAQTEAAQRNPGQPRPAYVFRYDNGGQLELEPIRIGLGTWEYTEVVSGLEDGEEVVLVPQALIQQRELLERIRSRSGVPGIRRE